MASVQEALVIALIEGFAAVDVRVKVEPSPTGSVLVKVDGLDGLFEIGEDGSVTPPDTLDPQLATVIELDMRAAAQIWERHQ